VGLVSFGFLAVLGLIVAEGRPLDVENDAQIVGLFLVDDLPQGVEEAVDGARRKAAGIGEARDGVVGTVEETIPVDEEEAFRIQSYLPSTI
jgi:hypothetical protein